jgi:hypothetical protein
MKPTILYIKKRLESRKKQKEESEFEIEKNVPLPNKVNIKNKYLLDKMDINNSFIH